MPQKVDTKAQVNILTTLGEVATKTILKTSDICLLVDNTGQILDSLSSKFPNSSKWKGKNLREILTSESIRKIFSYLDVSSNTLNRKKEALELNHTAEDGAEFAISYHANETGEPNQTLLIGHSLKAITDIQKQLVDTQIRLEREYETYRAYDVRYRVLLESSSEALVILESKSLKIHDYNETMARYLSNSGHNLKNVSLSNFFPNTSGEELFEKLKLSSQNTEVDNFFKLKNGLKVKIQPTFFRSGGDLLILCKIFSPKATSSTISYSESLFKEFYQKSADPMVITDIDGRIKFANDQFFKACNIMEVSDVEQKFFEEFLERGGVDQKVLIETLKSEGTVGTYVTKLKCEHGTNINVEISASKIRLDSKSLCGFILRKSNKGIVTDNFSDTISDRALENAMKLVGSAPLKDLVSDTSDVVERICIKTALELTRNNRVAAAEMLSLSRQSLYIKLRKYGLLKK